MGGLSAGKTKDKDTNDKKIIKNITTTKQQTRRLSHTHTKQKQQPYNQYDNKKKERKEYKSKSNNNNATGDETSSKD